MCAVKDHQCNFKTRLSVEGRLFFPLCGDLLLGNYGTYLVMKTPLKNITF